MIEGIDPLTEGKILYPEEDLKSASTLNQVSQAPGAYHIPAVPAHKGKNLDAEEQDRVAKGRVEKPAKSGKIKTVNKG